MHGLRIFCRLCMMLAALALPLGGMSAPAAWAQSAGTGSSDTIDNSAEYAMDPTMPSRAPSTAATLLTGAAIVGGAFVVGVAALGTATGGLLAAGAAAMLYATMP
jgi:hypothetical protein